MSTILSEDDFPTLSPETFLALQKFYQEQEEKDRKLQVAVESSSLDDIEIEEDWQLSQFWYDNPTIDYLVEVALKAVGPLGKIALVSCPSLYKKLKQEKGVGVEVTLFEYDRRFEAYGKDYIFYDYNFPLEVGSNGKYFDLAIVDPPFLSEECIKKNFITMRYISKDKLILCTGAIMAPVVESMNLTKTNFYPRHRKNLANDFCCFANFDINAVI